MEATRLPWRLEHNRMHTYPGGREIDRFWGTPDSCVRDDRPEAWIGSTTSWARGTDPTQGHSVCYSPYVEGLSRQTPSGRRYSECAPPSGSTRQYLIDAIRNAPADMTGDETGMGVLAKLLDAREQLGFQCHPDRDVARRYYGGLLGKTEAWVILSLRDDAKEPPYVLLGFREGVTRERFAALYRAGDIAGMEALAHRVPVRVGDVFLVPGGVPHAIGPGCFLMEIQEPSDATVVAWRPPWIDPAGYDAYDERVLATFAYGGLSYAETVRRYRLEPHVLREGAWGCEIQLIGPEDTPYFSCTRLEAAAPTAYPATGRAAIGLVLRGGGELTHPDVPPLTLQKADELFFPARIAEGFTIAPGPNGITLMLCHPGGAALTP